MRPLVGIAIVGFCLSAACSSPTSDESEECSSPGTLRCKGNNFQVCIAGFCVFDCSGPPRAPIWVTTDTCIAPEVCKIGTHPEIDPWLQNGCFATNSSCAELGAATCALPDAFNPSQLPVDLWTCSQSSQDQSLQWSLTRCDLQTPSAICLPDSYWTGDTPPTACYEPTGTCPPESRWERRCEENVIYFCQGPTIVDGKAVFDWIQLVDCAATGDVCRNGTCEKP